MGRTDQDVDFYAGVVAEVGGPVLELGCGTGRVTAPLAARTGATVVGLDIDREMLAVARSRYEGPLVCGDMRRFAFHERFGVVAIPFSSIQQLDGPGRMTCLSSVARHVRAGGVLALEVTALPLAELASVDVEVIAAGDVDGERVLLSAGLDVHEGAVTYRRRFDLDGTTIDADVTLTAVSVEQIAEESRAVGVPEVRFPLLFSSQNPDL